MRGRGAILDALTSLRDAYTQFDALPVDFDAVAAVIRRWIEAHTFAPRTGDGGVHLVDADSARFGDFDARAARGTRRRRVAGHASPQHLLFARAASRARLAGGVRAVRRRARRVQRSPAAPRVAPGGVDLHARGRRDRGGVDPGRRGAEAGCRFMEKDAPTTACGSSTTRRWHWSRSRSVRSIPRARAAAVRRIEAVRDRRRGMTTGHDAAAHSLSALERYQDCPFKFFAADVLRLEEPPEDEPTLSPRARGRFVHEVFQRFFEAWDARGHGTIDVDHIDEARALFEEVAEPAARAFPEAEALLERARLFGSAISVGIVDVVLGLEASRPTAVRERWLEYRLEGEFSLGASEGPRVLAEGRRRSHRSAGRQPAARHRLQVGLSAQPEARAAGADLRALRAGAARGARRPPLAGRRGGVRRVRRQARARARWSRRRRSGACSRARATGCSGCSTASSGASSPRARTSRGSAATARTRRSAARTTSAMSEPSLPFDTPDVPDATPASLPTAPAAPGPSIPASTSRSRRPPAPARHACSSIATSTCCGPASIPRTSSRSPSRARPRPRCASAS